MNKKLAPILCVFAIVLGVLAPTDNTWAQFGPPSLGDFMVDQMAEAYEHLEEYRKLCKENTLRVQAVRANYHAALRSGAGIEAARSELYRELDGKDLHYISTYVVSGIDSAQTKLLTDNCEPDGGIHPRLSGAFKDLIRELRSELGAKREDDIVILLNPLKLVAALETHQARANAYVHARNLLEIYASGVAMEDIFSAEAYLKILLELEYSLPTLSVLKPDMDSLPQQQFDLVVETFGKKLVMEAAETVLKLPKNKGGYLVDRFTTDQVHGTNDAFDAFRAILKTEPKGFIIFTYYKSWNNSWAGNVSTDAEIYDDLVDQHGEDRVHEVVESLRTAPRLFGGKIAVPDGAGYQVETDLWFLEKLLADPTYRIVDDQNFVYLAADDIDAISKAKDKIQVIYGRVNDVRWSDGGRKNNHKTGDYFHVYFAGVSKFGVMIYDHNFDWSSRFFGDDAQGLIGELVRVQGTVWQSQRRKDDSIRPDWNMRGSDGNFWVVAEGKWPDYLPVPDMEPARSMDELRAAVTHVDVEPASERPVDAGVTARELAAASKVSPLNCSDSGPQRKIDISKLTPGMGMGHYFYQIVRYAKPVAHYEAYSEVCTRVTNSVRDDFLLAAFGDLDDEYSVQLDIQVENEYQGYCVIRFDPQCNQVYLDLLKSKYDEVMTVLNSGDLQRERDRLAAYEESRKTKVVPSGSRTVATGTSQPVPARSNLPADWKKHAKIVGKYEALSEVCSGALEPAIRNDFLAALQGATVDQSTGLTAMIDNSYEKQRDARQKAGKPCNNQMLQRMQRQYQGAITAMAGTAK